MNTKFIIIILAAAIEIMVAELIMIPYKSSTIIGWYKVTYVKVISKKHAYL